MHLPLPRRILGLLLALSLCVGAAGTASAQGGHQRVPRTGKWSPAEARHAYRQSGRHEPRNRAGKEQASQRWGRAWPHRERVARLAGQAADAHVAQVTKYSERHGRYLIVSDLHWGLGKKRGEWHPFEEFHQGEAFALFIKRASQVMRKTTLVIGGDWIDFMDHVDAGASLPELNRTATGIIEGHREEVRALVEAVVRRNLRVLYIVGNHDVDLVRPEVRKHLVEEIMRVGGLEREADRRRFRERFAYSGHAVVMGQYGEGLVIHGHAADPANNWRSVMNPYDVDTSLPSNLGWDVVKQLYRKWRLEGKIDDEAKGKTMSKVLRQLFTTQSGPEALRILWRMAGNKARTSTGESVAERLDDRRAMLEWVKRTGFSEKMAAVPAPVDPPRVALSPVKWAQKLEEIYLSMPKPLHDRVDPGSPIMSLIKLGATATRRVPDMRAAETELIAQLTEKLPNVRYVTWGHSHFEVAVEGTRDGKEVGFFNSGSWVRTGPDWRLNVVVGETDQRGRLKMTGLFRTDPATGKPNVPPGPSEQTIQIPGWEMKVPPSPEEGSNE